MRLAFLVIAIAGCGFRSPDASKPDTDADITADADVDAAVDVDAAGFDPAACPSGYDVILPGFPRAKYRIITTNAVLKSQNTQCTVAGLSHLVVFETAL